MIEDYQQQTQTIGSRGEERHCGSNGNSSLTNGNGNSCPILAMYTRYIPSNPQTPEERKGQLRLNLLEVLAQERINGQKQLPLICEQPLIPPLFPKDDLAGYERIGSEIRKCTNRCGDNGYCRTLTIAIEEARAMARQMADLVTFQCTGKLYDPIANPDGNKLTITYYREKTISSN